MWRYFKELWVHFSFKFQWTGWYQLNLELTRTRDSDYSLMGVLAIDGVFHCYTIERPRNDPDYKPIPAGQYRVKMRPSAHWAKHGYPEVPGIFDVPGRSDIEIHIANYPKDLKGCVGVGGVRGTDCVFASKVAFDGLLVKLKGRDPITITIIDKESAAL